jgi:hypothetical protein
LGFFALSSGCSIAWPFSITESVGAQDERGD